MLGTHLIRRHLLHRLQGKQGPNVDTGTRKGTLRVVGDATVWSIISKRTVTKIVGVGLTAGRAQQPASCYIDIKGGATPSQKATQRTARVHVLITEWIGNGRYAQTRSKEAGHRTLPRARGTARFSEMVTRVLCDALSKDDVVAQLRWRSRRRSLPTAARSRIACLIIRCAHMLADDAAWASSACVESSVVPAARSSSGGETVPRSRVGAKGG